MLEIDAVHEAHDGDADPTHKEDNHQRKRDDHSNNGQDNQMESIALFGIGPHLSHAYQQRLIHKANREQDSLCREVQRVEIQLVVVAERRFHNELRHVVDKGIHEQRDEHWETLFEQGD